MRGTTITEAKKITMTEQNRLAGVASGRRADKKDRAFWARSENCGQGSPVRRSARTNLADSAARRSPIRAVHTLTRKQGEITTESACGCLFGLWGFLRHGGIKIPTVQTRGRGSLNENDPADCAGSLVNRCCGGAKVRAVAASRAARSDVLQLGDDLRQRLLGVAEQHLRLGVVIELVVDTRVAGAHRALEHDHVVCLIDLEDRHTVDRAFG